MKLLDTNATAARLGLKVRRVQQLKDAIGFEGPGRPLLFREDRVERFALKPRRAGRRPKRGARS